MQARKIAIAAATVIVLAGCGGPGQTVATVTSTLQTVITKTVTVTYTPPPPPRPKTMIDTDGRYQVGIDIVPGTYRSGGRGADGEADCYWARLRSLDTNDIIERNSSPGPQVVVIQASDAAFLTHNCQLWQKSD